MSQRPAISTTWYVCDTGHSRTSYVWSICILEILSGSSVMGHRITVVASMITTVLLHDCAHTATVCCFHNLQYLWYHWLSYQYVIDLKRYKWIFCCATCDRSGLRTDVWTFCGERGPRVTHREFIDLHHGCDEKEPLLVSLLVPSAPTSVIPIFLNLPNPTHFDSNIHFFMLSIFTLSNTLFLFPTHFASNCLVGTRSSYP